MRAAPWDPFRGGGQVLVPPLPADGWADGPVTVLAHVDRYPPEVNAGAEWMLHAMMRHLARAGHRAVVSTATAAYHDVDGVEVWPAEHADDLAAEADVAVGHLLWTREVVALAERHALPLLYVLHNDSQLAHWRLSPSNVSALVPNSLWLREASARWRGPQAVIRPPVALADYALPRDPAAGEWVTLVNPIREKGAELVYELAARRPDLRFAVVGGGYGHQIRPPRDLSNVERVPATGNIRDDVYARTRVLLVPSLYESWGRVACEALCSGIPVIAHPTPGLREALGAGAVFADGWRTGAADRWAAHLRALDDPGVYRAASQAARDRAAVLDGQAARDLYRWERLTRRAALAGSRLAAMNAHDPFAGHSPIAVHTTAPPPEPLHHQVILDWDGELESHVLGYTDDAQLKPRVRLPLDDGESREWGSQDLIGAGDVVRLVDRGNPARWMEGTVIEVGSDDAGEWAAVDVSWLAAEDEALRAELRGVSMGTIVVDGDLTEAEASAAGESIAEGWQAASWEHGSQEPGESFAEHVAADMAKHPIPDLGEPPEFMYADEHVPVNAADVIQWIGDATSPEDAQARTAAAWKVEQVRDGGPRKTVAAAVAPLDHTPPS